VAVNTPDSLHKEPVLCALEAGLDVLVPKPLADKIADAHEMIEKSRSCGRFIGVDFHKREDPRIKEARTRFQNGDYGSFQAAVWYMLDRLMVADPNHRPRFFASDDFAARNTPVSFLTVHVADAFMFIVGMKPVEVRAIGYKQKLPSLEPMPVDGYDLVDTEVMFENGGVCHMITGWALPNAAHATTVQSVRIIGSEGMLDLNLDTPGYHEVLADGIFERNPLFMNFEQNGMVSGYGVSSPGKIVRDILRFRSGEMEDAGERDPDALFRLGFYATLVCEGAHASLARGKETGEGVVQGHSILLKDLLAEEIGRETVP
jgi:predicted dehydrogenase